jgi:polyphosphate kinase 2
MAKWGKKSDSKKGKNTKSKSQIAVNSVDTAKIEQAVQTQSEVPVHTKRIAQPDTGTLTYDDLHKQPREELSKKQYEKELKKLFLELIKLQEWVTTTKARVVVIFEGRDAAGKGGVIKRITEPLNPRVCRIAALGTPSPKEKTQWYFQRYVAQLPAGGEIVLFDRSWYNRAGVERVMGFCTDDEYKDFLHACPEFEHLLVRSGIILIKYWFSVSDDIQEERFRERAENPLKRWKLSPMDLESRDKWVEYSKAKDAMFMHTDTRHAPWYVVNADVKERSRLNCISHMLQKIPYHAVKLPEIKFGKRKKIPSNYVRPPMSSQNIVPDYF